MLRIDKGWFQMGISSRREGWVRLFGVGLSVKDARRKDLLFSDRNRLGACVKVGPEKAIVHRPSRVAAVNRALLTESDALHRLADAVLHKRGERKKQKATRRLLRAAGAMLRGRSKGSF